MARYVDNFFKLSDSTKLHIKSLDSPFPTAVGEIVYYRTYSRRKKDGSQEHWADTVIRVTEGILSVRKDYYLKHNLGWNDEEWQQFGSEFAEYMFNMKFLPPGRGLWAMGTEYMYERGSAALNNCGACTCKDLILGATWTMDMLMCGVGVGAAVDWDGEVVIPDKSRYVHHVIADSREGWVNSLKHLLQAYIPDSEGKTLKFPKFDYSKVRKKGASIRGFGGTASGPGPLQDLHFRVEWFLDTYIKYKDTHSPDCVADLFEAFYEKGFYLGMPPGDSSRERFEKQHKQIKYSRKIKYDKTRCCADIINAIGVCVVAGNVRRSAEILLGDPDDDTFLNLKNNERDPSRQDICWMSNNSVRLDQTWQFSEFIPAIAERIRNNGEPGVINLKNIQRYGRFGREAGSKGIIEDQATVSNPCGEIPLEPYEICNLSECFPSRCFKPRDPNSSPLDEDDEYFDEDEFMKALEFATFYTSTVSLLPTQWEVTNKVIARNRRIGVSLSGIADVYDRIGQTHLTRLLRTGYSHVRSINENLAQDSGVRSSIRVTTVKPSGSISQLAGVSSGMHFPTFKYAIRRIMVSETSPICKVLVENNVPYEKSVYTPGTLVFSFPIDQGKTRAATDVSMWEQFALLATLQREWSDNMVSCTIYFQPETEGSHIEHALAQFIPLIKSVSMLPHTENGVYAQAPYEGIDRDKYIDLNSSIKRVDWSNYGGSDGEMPKYCTNGVCEVPAE